MKKGIFCLQVLLFVFAFHTDALADVSGSFIQKNAATVIIQVETTPPPPGAYIVEVQVPAGVNITGLKPESSGYNRKKGMVKWLLKNPGTGRKDLVIIFAGAVDASSLKGVIHYRHPVSGHSIANPIN